MSHELVEIGGTSFYRPASPGPGKAMWFLRAELESRPPPRLALADVWADRGEPSDRGHAVFFDRAPDDAVAAAIERALRRHLATPRATGFVWAKLYGDDVEISARVDLTLIDDAPAIATAVEFPVPRGMHALGFGEAAPVRARRDATGEIDGVVVTYAGRPGVDRPTGAGIALPLAGGDVGCVRFLGLVDAADFGPTRERVVKQVVEVSYDPLRPFDPARSHLTFTGRALALVRDATGYHLEPEHMQ